jgi:hypothetical protein
MICFANPVLTEDSYIMQEEELSIKYMSAKSTLGERPSTLIRDNPIISSEKILHKDYYRKGSDEKKNISLVTSLEGLYTKTN